jgi:hypothetical protein
METKVDQLPRRLSPYTLNLCRTLLQFLRKHPNVLIGTISKNHSFTDEDIEAILVGFDMNLKRWHEQDREKEKEEQADGPRTGKQLAKGA